MRKNNFLGFTLIELLIVVAVIGALAAIGLIAFTGQQKSARDTQRKSDLQQYRIALENYANANNSAYPIQASTIALGTFLCLVVDAPLKTLMSGCLEDPIFNSGSNINIYYRYQSDSSGTKYVLWANLERTSNNFVVCSGGKSGELSTSVSISGGSCPL